MQALPPILTEFASYKMTVQNRSKRTVEQYCQDLILLFRFLIAHRAGTPTVGEEFDAVSVSGVDTEFVKSITTEDLYLFLMYTANERGNGARARARKLSAIKSFYKFLYAVKRAVAENPAKDIESPQIKASLPKYLTLDESITLLQTIETDSANPFRVRNYCIITLFLNCGMRLSELVGINLSDIDKRLEFLRVVGKGNKERIVYLNLACRKALTDYLEVRAATKEIKDKNALFLSRYGSRMSAKAVQYTVYKYLDAAGLGYKQLSTHKLRHTAATLMYRTGKVDVRVLKDILGHEQLNTTQIYTHVSDEQMQNAMEQNPLSGKGTKKDDGE